jgi:hypothetical protein
MSKSFIPNETAAPHLMRRIIKRPFSNSNTVKNAAAVVKPCHVQVFVRGLLDRLKVQPQVFRREEYKAALAPLTGTGFDPAHKENVTSLLKVRSCKRWQELLLLLLLQQLLQQRQLW